MSCRAHSRISKGREKPSRNPLPWKGWRKNPQGRRSLSLPVRKPVPSIRIREGYVALIAKGKFKEALELIREVNPLPAVCGFICHHPCEEACLREEVDHPIPIRLLKRFVAEYEQKEGRTRMKANKKKTREDPGDWFWACWPGRCQ